MAGPYGTGRRKVRERYAGELHRGGVVPGNPQTGGMSAPQPRPRAGIPKAPGLQDQGRDALKTLYMQKKRRR